MSLKIVDARELAGQLGVTYATVLDWARMGKIPSIKTGTGRRVFNLDQVVETLCPSARTRKGRPYAVVGGGE